MKIQKTLNLNIAKDIEKIIQIKSYESEKLMCFCVCEIRRVKMTKHKTTRNTKTIK